MNSPEGLREQIARLILGPKSSFNTGGYEPLTRWTQYPHVATALAKADAIISGPLQEQLKGSSGGRVQAAPDGATEPSAAEQRLTAITCSFAQHIDRDGVGWSQMRHDDVCALLGEVERLGRALSRARDVLAAAQEIFADDGYFRRSEDAGEAIALIDAALGGQRDGVL
jgi:hypothetical protein